jgi:hypothetical protein
MTGRSLALPADDSGSKAAEERTTLKMIVTCTVDKADIHVDRRMPDRRTPGSPFYRRICALPGIEQCEIHAHALTVHKGLAFRWEDLVPSIGKIIQRYCYGNRKDDIVIMDTDGVILNSKPEPIPELHNSEVSSTGPGPSVPFAWLRRVLG